jgi:hypothetical protein
MATINDNYLKLKAGYLLPEIARWVKAFEPATPDAKIIRLPNLYPQLVARRGLRLSKI